MNREQMLARRAAILAELTAISQAAKLAARAFTDDERARIATLSAEDDTLKAQVEALDRDAATQAAIAGRIAAAATGNGRRTQPDEPGTVPVSSLAPNPDTVPATPIPQFRSLGEQLQAIAQANITPHRIDERLRWESLTPATGSAVAGVPSDGGYLIQKDFATDLRGKMFELGEILKRVRKIPIGPGSDGLKLNVVDETSRATGSRWGGVQVYWAAEADVATAKKPKFRQMELELKDLIGLAYASNKLLSDASALESVFMQAFSEEMTFTAEDAIINGTGAGMPLGIINSGAVVSVAKESGQSASTLEFANLSKMWARMWARSRQTAVWLYNQNIEPQLFGLAFPVGTGGVPVFLPPGGLSESPFATLFGRPMLPVEYCATLGTTGDLMLVDPSQYLIIEKGGIQQDQSLHVRFTSNENTFRFIYRLDGQPVWNSPLTPYKGSSDTLSPFVKLDTRA